MKEKFKEAIEALLQRAGSSKDSNDALKFSQAALNLAHTQQVAWLTFKPEAGGHHD